MAAKKKPDPRKRLPGRATGYAKNKMTKKRWQTIIEAIANGVKRHVAIRQAKVTRQTFDAYLISYPPAIENLRQANLTWIRRRVPVELIEELLMLISMGMTKSQAQEEMLLDDEEMVSIYHLLLHDPQMREQYDLARKLQCESWADECIDIADDGRNDTYEVESKNGRVYTKTNYDVIQRSRERVNTRQWNMKAFHRDRFGDKVQQDLNANVNVNHEEMLAKARRRKENAKKQSRKITKQVAGAVVSAASDAAVPDNAVKH